MLFGDCIPVDKKGDPENHVSGLPVIRDLVSDAVNDPLAMKSSDVTVIVCKSRILTGEHEINEDRRANLLAGRTGDLIDR